VQKAAFVTATIAALSKNMRDITPTVLEALDSLKVEDSSFTVASPSELREANSVKELKKKVIRSPVVVGSVFSKRLRRLAPKFMLLDNAVSLFEGRLYQASFARLRPSSLKLQRSSADEGTVEGLLKRSEGDFAAVIVKPGIICAGRDPLGVQPFYYGENAELVALAGNMKALWKLGIQEPCSFPPGNLALVTPNGFEFKPVKSIDFRRTPLQITLDEAAEKLLELLKRSVRVRVEGVKELAVAFSGGLDSSVIAFIAKKYVASVNLVHVSLHGKSETEDARRAAEELDLPLDVHLFEPRAVEETASKVVALVEEPDPVKIAVGIPFYWVAQKVSESGLSTLLAGQGADELFGGYQRYVDEYLSRGEAAVRRTMFNDVAKLSGSNLERDGKICGFHGVELRLPFASFGLAQFASSLPVSLKIERKQDGLRKLVLRRLACRVGLSDSIVSKPKKAVQYATGVNVVLSKIAKKHGLTVGEYLERIFAKEKANG
jgi:asparagine synthase (glutamine-hydrolysing)